MEETTVKTRTIPLTDRAPVKIREDQWPVVAWSSDHDGEIECQANHKWRITVRRHSDGRTIVYGKQDNQCEPDIEVGYLLPNEDGTVRAIRKVGEEIGANAVTIQACIADLPAEEI